MRLQNGFEPILKPLQCRCNILSTNNKVAKLGKIEQKFTDNRTNLHPKTPLPNLLNILLHFLISLGHKEYDKYPQNIIYLRAQCKLQTTDYGCPMKPFFIEIPNFWTGAENLGR